MRGSVPKSLLKLEERIARSIAAPSEDKPTRLPTFPNLERTAVLGFTTTGTVTVGTEDYTQVPGQFLAVRDPGYPVWVNRPVVSSGVYSLYSSNTFSARVITGTETIAMRPFATDAYSNDTLSFTGMLNIDYYKHPVVHIGGVSYMLVGCGPDTGIPAFLEIFAAVGTAVNITGASITVDAYTFADGVRTLVLPSVGTRRDAVTPASPIVSFCYNLPSNVFAYRVTSATIAYATAATWTLNRISWGTSCTPPFTGVTYGTTTVLTAPTEAPTSASWLYSILPLCPPPEVEASSVPWQDVRCNAAAVLFTNVSRVLNKEGTAAGARVSTATFPAFTPSLWNGFSAVHPEDRYFGALENGLYTFTLPDAGSEVFRSVHHGLFDIVTIPSGTIPNTALCLTVDPTLWKYANCVALTDIDNTAATTLAYSLFRHTEFRTTSVLFDTGVAPYTLESYHSSQMALSKMGVFHENPVHLAAIANAAATAVRALWPVLRPYAQQAAAVVVPKVANWVAGKMGVKGDMTQKQMTMPSKSAKKKQAKQRKQKK